MHDENDDARVVKQPFGARLDLPRPATGTSRRHLTEEIKKIAIVAMTAQSNPYAPAKKYREALIEICNRALATLDRIAKAEAR